MKALPNKTKQLFAFIAKLLIVSAAFYFIYTRLAGNDTFDTQKLAVVFSEESAVLYIILIAVLTFLNRFLEILKWQNLAGTLEPITLGKAAVQVLAAVTVAIFTPNGLGEYPAKVMYFDKKDAWQVIFLNLLCNGIQMIIAALCGLAGLFAFNAVYHVIPTYQLLIIIGIIATVAVLLFVSRKITVKGYSIRKIIEKINVLPKQVHRKNILLALLRYLCIVHQHYLLFLLFGIHQPYLLMLSAISGVYLLGSALPNFTFIDFAVRGGVAVYFFGIIGINEWIVLLIATLQWILNIVLPVSAGAYFVLSFKIQRKTIREPHQV